MKIQKMKIPAILGALLLAGTLSAGAQMNSDSLYKEPYRPQYHFSPEKGWIGDPSGFMYYQGKYHMYWWGKVESTDLVHYQQITPYAMTGTDDNISYFTGSAVIDKNNTAGFGKGAYVAAYTVFEKDSKKQAQGISFSHDGKTFHYYEGNPVLDLWSTEFRDPTVFWHEPTQKWVMVVAKALEKKIKFYTSPDLKSWTWTSDFGPAGDSEKSWECPDLFQLPVDGDSDKKRWVMVVSVNWAQEQYFIGDFDGTSFKLMENHPAEPLYVDKGLDFYASRTFQDFDGTLDSKISMGWVATWDYAPVAPSKYGKGFWSIPRTPEQDDLWCDGCEEHTYQIRESELMSDTVEPWWNDGTTEEDREIITGLNPENFSPKDDRKAFRDACDMWWNGRTNDEKIRLWRQATAPEEE